MKSIIKTLHLEVVLVQPERLRLKSLRTRPSGLLVPGLEEREREDDAGGKELEPVNQSSTTASIRGRRGES